MLLLNRGNLMFDLIEEADVDTEEDKKEEKEDPTYEPEFKGNLSLHKPYREHWVPGGTPDTDGT